MDEEDVLLPVRDGYETRVRVYNRKGAAQPAPVAVIIHGGGFITSDRFDEDWTCRIIVERIGAVALSVEYRLAPEHPFPAAIIDRWDVVKWAPPSKPRPAASPPPTSSSTSAARAPILSTAGVRMFLGGRTGLGCDPDALRDEALGLGLERWLREGRRAGVWRGAARVLVRCRGGGEGLWGGGGVGV
ncbi:hypothetical protein GTA08_BOTSDO12048 [Neofusicoccum parvum]|nr:hypothetical protein GTA08_BOTSDO12048 [Neofusicoccum parvum]